MGQGGVFPPVTVQTPLHSPREEAERNGAERVGQEPKACRPPWEAGQDQAPRVSAHWCLLPGLAPGCSPRGLWALGAGADSGPDTLPTARTPEVDDEAMEKFARALASLSEDVQMVLDLRRGAGELGSPSSLPRPPRRRGWGAAPHGGPLPSSLCPGASSPILTPPRLSLPHRAVPRLGEPLPAPLG